MAEQQSSKLLMRVQLLLSSVIFCFIFMWGKTNTDAFLVYYYRGFIVVFRQFLNIIFNPFNTFNWASNFENKRFLSNELDLNYFLLKNKWNFFKSKSFFWKLDYLYLFFFSRTFLLSRKQNYNVRVISRLKQTKWSFYSDVFVKNTARNTIITLSISFLSGLRYLWLGLRYWFLGLILGLTAFYYLMYIRLLPFNKIIFEWILIIMFLYWLMSGFVFFIKKYQYSKFTSVIQRFWKRTYILFWLIESGVFATFFYLTLNASEEPTYMYDQLKLYKTHLFSWRWFLIKLIPMLSLIIIGYFTQLSLKWNLFSKQSSLLLLLTLIIVYLVWLEFYQFFHVINFYGNLVWVYDYDEFLWNLELEFRRTRLSNNYVAVCLMAKFWHLVFIFVFWVFFILRVNEIKRVRYPLFTANLQNFIILYIMSWLYMYPWLKFLFRPHLDTPYYWFFLNVRRLGFRVFFNDIKLFYFSFINNLFDNLRLSYTGFNSGLFYYWFESSNLVGFDQYKKFIIRDYIIHSINLTNSVTSLTSSII